MKIDKALLAGSTAMLVLKLLDGQDRYGYQMIEELERRSDHTFELKAGTLYPLLHTLEQKGWLESYDRPTDGRVRRYYRLTKSGSKQLREKQAEWQAYTKAVNQVLGGASLAV